MNPYTELYITSIDPGTDFPKALKLMYSAIERYVYGSGNDLSNVELTAFMRDILKLCTPEDFDWDMPTEGIGADMIRLESKTLDEAVWERIRETAIKHGLFVFDGIHKTILRP